MPVHQVASYFIKEHVKMRNAFAFYLTSEDWLLRTKISIFNTLSFANEQFYDPIKGILQFDVSDLVLIKPSGRNQVRLQRLKNKLDKQEIDGIKRSILAIGDARVVLGDWQQSVYFL